MKNRTDGPIQPAAICVRRYVMGETKQSEVTCRIGSDSVLDEAGELLLVRILVLLHQVAHVLRHVDAHDVLAVDLGVKLLALSIIARETLGAEGGKEGGGLVEMNKNQPHMLTTNCFPENK